MFDEAYVWNRANQARYFEVYLKTPLEELRRRDPKGIYRRFDAGELTNVAGVDLAVDEPPEPHLVIDFDPKASLSDCAERLLSAWTYRTP
jgi:adenylylsulfate kinase